MDLELNLEGLKAFADLKLGDFFGLFKVKDSFDIGGLFQDILGLLSGIKNLF